jgi:uncharacterized protein YigA (DUF484 family)
MEEEEELSNIKQKVDWGFGEYNYDHDYSDYNYLYEYTKEFLEKNQKHILEIMEILKDNEKVIYEQDIQLEEKEEEIDKLKNEISQVKEKKKEYDDLNSQKHMLEIKEMLKDNERVTSKKYI